MIDNEKRRNRLLQKEKVRRRVQVQIDPDNYEFFPAKKQTDYYDNDVPQRVGIYVRVSTDNVQQTTSYELQKKYYEDFVVRHPNWTLVEIYADEGISGTSLRHRDAFNKMIADAKSGLLDMIITKSVSRFSRNVTDCNGIVRDLAELKSPVGVFFESECIFSLNDDSAMALSFQATMAEEESHTRSRSMETSLRMRLCYQSRRKPRCGIWRIHRSSCNEQRHLSHLGRSLCDSGDTQKHDAYYRSWAEVQRLQVLSEEQEPLVKSLRCLRADS